MKNIIVLLILLLPFSCKMSDNVDRPRLVVGIVVDQMRQEYLYRFYDKFGSDGFKRLMNKGYMMRNAHFNYVPTKTGPGHSSVYTGTTPRVHGVIANDWFEKKSGKFMYCAGDSTVESVGGSAEAGKISAKNLLSTTITDELGQFFQGRSKVVGISIKDRGAALPAGHNPTGAYWYDSNTGEFMSSSYYINELPKWVKDFNDKDLVSKYMSQIWNTTYPIDEYVESADDDRFGEALKGGKSKPTFPYDLPNMVAEESPESLIKTTPFGNSILKELAIAAIEGENMGVDEITDFLAVSFSSTDYIGHAFGPYSKEIEDTYIKLDQDLEALFMYLDEKIGPYQYNVFLTADHAVAEIPYYLKNKNYPVDYFLTTEVLQQLTSKLKIEFNHDSLISSISNEQIFLNKNGITESGAEESQVKEFVINHLEGLYGVAGVYDSDYINGYSGSNKDVNMLSAGFNFQRSGDILFTMNPGWLEEWNKKELGTTHGSHYTYDTHVPMLFYGMKIRAGESVKYHPITDLAPTISMLLGIKFPSGATGQPIEELFDNEL